MSVLAYDFNQYKFIIKNFLLLEDKDDQLQNTANNDVSIKNNKELLSNYSIVVLKATAKWTNIQLKSTIENINLVIKPGQLVAIIGRVGAGKV